MSGELLTEINRAGVGWTDISDKVYVRNPVTINRGRADEDGNAAPSKCTLTFDNRDGRFSPRNPVSPYFGQIGRNTPIRVSLQQTPVLDAYSNTSGTGDLSWTHTPTGAPTGVCVFVWQYNTNAFQINSVTYGGVAMTRYIGGLFVFGATNVVGYMYFLNRDIPTGAQTVVVDTTATILRQASALTFTGGSHIEIDALANAYSNAAPTTNPTASITTSKPALLVGSLLSDLDDGSTISVGTGFTELGEHDIGTETVSVERSTTMKTTIGSQTVNWTASSGHWGIMAVAFRCVSYRFWGEIASLPPRWDESGKDAYVPIEANGILRRLGQGTDPAATGLRDYILDNPTYLAAYYPLSGGEGTTYSLNLAPLVYYLQTRFYGQSALNLAGTAIQNPVFTYGKDLGATWLGTGMELNATGNAYMRGDVGIGFQNVAFDMVFQAVPPGLGVLTIQLQDYASQLWAVDLNTAADAGTLQFSFTDPALGPVGYLATGQLSALQDTTLHHLRLQLTKSGADTTFAVYIDGTSVSSGTVSGYNISSGISLFRLFYTRYTGQTVMNIGHLAVWASSSAANIPAISDVTAAAFGYVGETGGDRIDRVTALDGIPAVVIGNNADTTVMGAQYAEPRLTQIRDVENTDLGILTETRDDLSLLYRTRTSMYAQTPVITINYSAGELSPPFEPVDDDQLTRNDITATRRDGDSSNAAQTTGPLSVSDPPTGVGRYKDERTVNVETDAMLPGVAQWLLNIGTLDQARYPTVTVNLLAPQVVANSALSTGIYAVEVGDLIRITGLAAVGIYADVDLIVLGYEEVQGPVEKTFTFNCMPAAPYAVAVWGSGVGTGPDHYDTDGSVLTSSLTSTATSFSVTKTGTSLWTTDAGEFPLDIYVAGERMTVTNITSATSPQTFTVTRSVNSVVKSHAASTPVRLWKTPRYGL